MSLAIFDLDNTLLAGDSDYLWGQFLAEQGVVDSQYYEQTNNAFYRQYQEGTLDIDEFLAFQLAPLSQYAPSQLERWRSQYLEEKIRPIMLPKAQNLLSAHQAQGHTLLIITATNRFITQPIAEMLQVDHLIATEPEIREGRYTGRVSGIPSYREGKVIRLKTWLKTQSLTLEEASWFYSDSHNDIPLLEQVTYPVAVNPDKKLDSYARINGWNIINLRENIDSL
ncbi:haloacid dehalogenase-like (HAD) superfamily protein [Candidatus Nitrosoglobus terrae]|uniref:Haloacid dehalogenase-like (HAD) superfamily protein n=1 Tax=Candidatus Nitrosoglobus terrae TaxID=1630141 RepID=A0A1Q2SP91_9GAMM|nr:HAD family hydrolase [Candidatus Nitrosoglobus terrae]BAW80954.1 haloacid dehalogenase-like (HAD) superfamily protein [Candidatus Nitrosoglobus terrae]